jgi:hypothetical protein
MRVSGYGALLRLLVSACQQVACPNGYPLGLLGTRPPRRFQLQRRPADPERDFEVWGNLLREYLDGHSDRLTLMIREHLPASAGGSFWRSMQDTDLELVQHFYERGPRRNRQLKERHGIEERLINVTELDDLLVAERPRTSTASPKPQPSGLSRVGSESDSKTVRAD